MQNIWQFNQNDQICVSERASYWYKRWSVEARLEAENGERGLQWFRKIKTHHIKLRARRVDGWVWEAAGRQDGQHLVTDWTGTGREEQGRQLDFWLRLQRGGSTLCWWQEPKEIRFEDWAEEGNLVLNIMNVSGCCETFGERMRRKVERREGWR